MGAESDITAVVTDLHVWVVVLLMANPCNSIHEGHSLIVIFKAEFTANLGVIGTDSPVRYLLLKVTTISSR